jgi:hypothetical protein
MKIKNPVLVSKEIVSVYEVDVEGTKIPVFYSYSMDDEGKGGWDWDLSPCYEGLNENQIQELDYEFEEVISEL